MTSGFIVTKNLVPSKIVLIYKKPFFTPNYLYVETRKNHYRGLPWPEVVGEQRVTMTAADSNEIESCFTDFLVGNLWLFRPTVKQCT